MSFLYRFNHSIELFVSIFVNSSAELMLVIVMGAVNGVTERFFEISRRAIAWCEVM